MQRNFYTIGYEGSRLEVFIAALKRAGIKTLVDVRDVPLSRKRGFSKKALAAALLERGIKYVHLKGLGDPKPGRLAARSGEYDLFRLIFASHMMTEDARRDLSRAVELVCQQTTCLMCFEHAHHRCHRSIVAQHIIDQTGLRAHHLLTSGAIDNHDRPDHARLAGR